MYLLIFSHLTIVSNLASIEINETFLNIKILLTRNRLLKNKMKLIIDLVFELLVKNNYLLTLRDFRLYINVMLCKSNKLL